MKTPSRHGAVRGAFLLALVGLAVACGDAAGPADGAARVFGSVTDEKTAAGIEGMVVVLMDAAGTPLAAAATDGLGEFEFGRVPAGTYTLRLTGLELAGLDPRFHALEPPEQEVTVSGEPVRAFFTVVVLIPSRVVGDVSCGGAAVEGALIRVVGGETDTTVETDAVGRYAATNLAAGTYAVIPVDAPCPLQPDFHAVEVLPGQAVEADFAG
ncbi:MAG: MSCRAMM family protein [Longimicrobiales bacterium]